MKLKHLFYIKAIIFLTLIGCGGTETPKTANSGIKLRLSADSSAVELFNIPLNITEELRADSLGSEQWKDFFAVYEEIADKEMRDFQPAIDGSYNVTDSLVEFIPAGGFTKGKAYFSRCYTKDLLEEPEDIISKRDLSPTGGFLEFTFKIK
ncbi:hypothetical protein [Daejeonella lutea]|uniref:Uncharacterized protein n=1 Tax=Daejeonella lutea TaxID=572036 RepID=A0A1T5DF49_9SPHI|nr:hypothetical protein [Daejeonella lutea]SKB70319.1 hypothetical protein SAMN05661099_2311 [Daejeonella lutea]